MMLLEQILRLLNYDTFNLISEVSQSLVLLKGSSQISCNSRRMNSSDKSSYAPSPVKDQKIIPNHILSILSRLKKTHF